MRRQQRPNQLLEFIARDEVRIGIYAQNKPVRRGNSGNGTTEVSPKGFRFRVGPVGMRSVGRSDAEGEICADTADEQYSGRGDQNTKIFQLERGLHELRTEPNLTSVRSFVSAGTPSKNPGGIPPSGTAAGLLSTDDVGSNPLRLMVQKLTPGRMPRRVEGMAAGVFGRLQVGGHNVKRQRSWSGRKHRRAICWCCVLGRGKGWRHGRAEFTHRPTVTKGRRRYEPQPRPVLLDVVTQGRQVLDTTRRAVCSVCSVLGQGVRQGVHQDPCVTFDMAETSAASCLDSLPRFPAPR